MTHTSQSIVAAAARLFGVSEADIVGPSRARCLTEPRQALAYALDQDGWSQMRIGAVLGGRDHTTVCHHVRNAVVRMAVDPQFAARVRALMAEHIVQPIHQFQHCVCTERIADLEARIARLEAITR